MGIDEVSFYKRKLRRRTYDGYSKNKFFNGLVVVKVDYDKITFRKPTLDTRYNIITGTPTGNGYTFSITTDLDLEKRYVIDEDSDEDCLILYLDKENE